MHCPQYLWLHESSFTSLSTVISSRQMAQVLIDSVIGLDLELFGESTITRRFGGFIRFIFFFEGED